VLTSQGKHQEALVEWEAAGVEASELRVWGDQALRQEHYDEALYWYGQMAHLAPRPESSALCLQYLTLMRSGAQESAIDRLREAISVDRGWSDPSLRFLAWYLWGVHLYEAERWPEAELALAKAVEVSPDGGPYGLWVLSEAYRRIGLMQLQNGKQMQAVQSLEKAVGLSEQNQWAHVALGEALFLLDPSRAAEAEAEFAAAMHIRPADAEIWAEAIRFWQANEQPERALALCLQAVGEGVRAGLEGLCPSP
jgi:tetratricopeptide (TPR) repeat protein